MRNAIYTSHLNTRGINASATCYKCAMLSPTWGYLQDTETNLFASGKQIVNRLIAGLGAKLLAITPIDVQ